MILFGLFVLICMCIIHPSLLIVYLSPVVIFFICMGYHLIRWKIKTGYFRPWEHFDELYKKGIEY